MKLTIDITDEMYQAVKNGTWCGSELWYNALMCYLYRRGDKA